MDIDIDREEKRREFSVEYNRAVQQYREGESGDRAYKEERIGFKLGKG